MSTRAIVSSIKAEEIRALRTTLGLTQAELGAHLGIGHMQVHKLENATQPITRTMALALASLIHAQAAPATLARLPASWRNLLQPPTPTAPRGPKPTHIKKSPGT